MEASQEIVASRQDELKHGLENCIEALGRIRLTANGKFVFRSIVLTLRGQAPKRIVTVFGKLKDMTLDDEGNVLEVRAAPVDTIGHALVGRAVVAELKRDGTYPVDAISITSKYGIPIWYSPLPDSPDGKINFSV